MESKTNNNQHHNGQPQNSRQPDEEDFPPEIVFFKMKDIPDGHIYVSNNKRHPDKRCTPSNCACNENQKEEQREILAKFCESLMAVVKCRIQMCPWTVHNCLTEVEDGNIFGVNFKWLEGDDVLGVSSPPDSDELPSQNEVNESGNMDMPQEFLNNFTASSSQVSNLESVLEEHERDAPKDHHDAEDVDETQDMSCNTNSQGNTSMASSASACEPESTESYTVSFMYARKPAYASAAADMENEKQRRNIRRECQKDATINSNNVNKSIGSFRNTNEAFTEQDLESEFHKQPVSSSTGMLNQSSHPTPAPVGIPEEVNQIGRETESSKTMSEADSPPVALPSVEQTMEESEEPAEAADLELAGNNGNKDVVEGEGRILNASQNEPSTTRTGINNNDSYENEINETDGESKLNHGVSRRSAFHIHKKKRDAKRNKLSMSRLKIAPPSGNKIEGSIPYPEKVLKKIEETKPETMLITCRSIRIGSYRQPSSVEENFEVSISKLGFVFNIRYPHLQYVHKKICIPTKMITELYVRAAKPHVVIIVGCKPEYGKWVNEVLKFEGSAGKDLTNFYCPATGSELQKKIVIFPQNFIRESQKSRLSNIFGTVLKELNAGEANKFLVRLQPETESESPPNDQTDDHSRRRTKRRENEQSSPSLSPMFLQPPQIPRPQSLRTYAKGKMASEQGSSLVDADSSASIGDIITQEAGSQAAEPVKNQDKPLSTKPSKRRACSPALSDCSNASSNKLFIDETYNGNGANTSMLEGSHADKPPGSEASNAEEEMETCGNEIDQLDFVPFTATDNYTEPGNLSTPKFKSTQIPHAHADIQENADAELPEVRKERESQKEKTVSPKPTSSPNTRSAKRRNTGQVHSNENGVIDDGSMVQKTRSSNKPAPKSVKFARMAKRKAAVAIRASLGSEISSGSSSPVKLGNSQKGEISAVKRLKLTDSPEVEPAYSQPEARPASSQPDTGRTQSEHVSCQSEAEPAGSQPEMEVTSFEQRSSTDKQEMQIKDEERGKTATSKIRRTTDDDPESVIQIISDDEMSNCSTMSNISIRSEMPLPLMEKLEKRKKLKEMSGQSGNIAKEPQPQVSKIQSKSTPSGEINLQDSNKSKRIETTYEKNLDSKVSNDSNINPTSQRKTGEAEEEDDDIQIIDEVIASRSAPTSKSRRRKSFHNDATREKVSKTELPLSHFGPPPIQIVFKSKTKPISADPGPSEDLDLTLTASTASPEQERPTTSNDAPVPVTTVQSQPNAGPSITIRPANRSGSDANTKMETNDIEDRPGWEFQGISSPRKAHQIARGIVNITVTLNNSSCPGTNGDAIPKFPAYTGNADGNKRSTTTATSTPPKSLDVETAAKKEEGKGKVKDDQVRPTNKTQSSVNCLPKVATSMNTKNASSTDKILKDTGTVITTKSSPSTPRTLRRGKFYDPREEAIEPNKSKTIPKFSKSATEKAAMQNRQRSLSESESSSDSKSSVKPENSKGREKEGDPQSSDQSSNSTAPKDKSSGSAQAQRETTTAQQPDQTFQGRDTSARAALREPSTSSNSMMTIINGEIRMMTLSSGDDSSSGRFNSGNNNNNRRDTNYARRGDRGSHGPDLRRVLERRRAQPDRLRRRQRHNSGEVEGDFRHRPFDHFGGGREGGRRDREQNKTNSSSESSQGGNGSSGTWRSGDETRRDDRHIPGGPRLGSSRDSTAEDNETITRTRRRSNTDGISPSSSSPGGSGDSEHCPPSLPFDSIRERNRGGFRDSHQGRGGGGGGGRGDFHPRYQGPSNPGGGGDQRGGRGGGNCKQQGYRNRNRNNNRGASISTLTAQGKYQHHPQPRQGVNSNASCSSRPPLLPPPSFLPLQLPPPNYLQYPQEPYPPQYFPLSFDNPFVQNFFY